MTYVNQDVSLYAGDDKILEVTTYDENGDVLDITAATLSYVLSQSGTAVETMTIGDGITVTDATNGAFEIRLDNADTTGWSGNYDHVCRLTDASSNVSTLFTGQVRVYD